MALPVSRKPVVLGVDGEASRAARLAPGHDGAGSHPPGDAVASGEGARLAGGSGQPRDPGGRVAIAGRFLTGLRVLTASTMEDVA